MSGYNELKNAIRRVVKTNNNREITGQNLQSTLTSMVNSLGANYHFAGFASPDTNPGTPDQNIFYIASEEGTYVNFNGIILKSGLSFLMWNGKWSSETISVGEVTKSWVQQNYVSIAFFNELFELYNDSTKIAVNDTIPVDKTKLNIKAMFGFWTEQYISALGKNDNGGSSSGVDMATVWSALAGSTDEQINESHLTTALSGYATMSWVSQIFATITSIPTKLSQLTNDTGFITSAALPTKVSQLVNDAGYVTASIVNGYATQSWVSQNFATITSIPTKVSQLSNDVGYITSSGSCAYATSAGNSDTVDNLHASNFGQIYIHNTEWATSSDIPSDLATGFHEIHVSGVEYSSILSGKDFNGSYWQLYFHPNLHYTDEVFYRKPSKGLVRQFAFTDSNVASATKLQTARTIWGNTFDGTQDVAGDLILPHGKKIVIGGASLYWDADNNAVKIDGSVYATRGLSALGNSDVAGGSGSGIDMATIWSALAGSTDEQINESHLTTALSGYATMSWVSQIFATIASIPTKLSQLANDTGFITSAALPTKVSQLVNDAGYVTASIVNGYATQSWVSQNFATITSIPTKVSQLSNDSGYITSSGSCAYAASAGNADTVDNLHASNFGQIYIHNTEWATSSDIPSDLATGFHEIHVSGVEYSSILSGKDFGGSYWQLYFHPNLHYTDEVFYRKPSKGLVRQFAFTDSNVASASKLQTARTIWGQSFDGTSNVDGNLSCNGQGSFNSLQIGNITIIYDAANKGLRIAGGGLYTDSYLSSLGVDASTALSVKKWADSINLTEESDSELATAYSIGSLYRLINSNQESITQSLNQSVGALQGRCTSLEQRVSALENKVN